MNKEFDPEFDPDDIEELEQAFARVDRDLHKGYRMEFHLSKETALDMIDEWQSALMGSRDASNMCWSRYAYIVSEIILAVEEFG